MSYSSKEIKTIGYSKENIFIGSLRFQGILSITTIDGDFYQNFYKGYQKEINLFKPQKKSVYFKQDYEDSSYTEWNRIPDYRRQLLWMPELKFDKNEVIEFYASDIGGNYMITLEGFSSKDVPISISKMFYVK